MRQANGRSALRMMAVAGLSLVGLALAGCGDRLNDPLSPVRPRDARPSFEIVPGSGSWTAKASMPTAREGSAAGVIDGILYVAGGYGSAGQLAINEAYNPGTNSWTTRASMPAGRYGGDGAGVIGGELYVVGGWTVSPALPNRSLFIYNPVSNSWRSGPNMPVLSACGSTGVINGKLYVTTACDGYNGYRSFLHVYNPMTSTWTQLASSPNAHAAPAAGVIEGKLYVAGGNNASGIPSTTLDVYDPAAGTWTTKAPMSEVHMGPGGAVVDGKLYVIGGWNGSQYGGTVEVYDPETNAWTTLASMPTPRYELATGVIAGIVYAAGGNGGASRLAVHEAFAPAPPQKADQTIAFDALTNRTFGDPPFAISATSSSGLSVSFTASGSCTVAGTTVSLTAVGACTITADQGGDASFNPAPSVSQAFSIANANQTITFDPLGNKTFGDPPFALSATASSGLPVSFAASGNCTVAGETVTITGAGSCTVTASQAGDATYSAATPVPQTFAIALASQAALSVTGPASATPADGTVQLGTSGGSGTGAVTFSATSSSACTVYPSSGVVTITSGTGTCDIRATKAGDSNYNPVTSPQFSIVVRMANQTISFGALGARTYGDAPFAVSANASSGLPVALAASGDCTVAGTLLTITGAGACTITATQLGDHNYNPAPSIVQGFAIAKATPVILWNAPSSMVYGAALGGVQLNATATGVSGAPLSGVFSYSPPAGTVLNLGSQPLAASFTPDDGSNYTGAAKSVSITVLYNTAAGRVFLQPINLPTQQQSVFKAGSTIPVKFQLFLADGMTPVSSAVATIRVNKMSDGLPVDVVSNVPNAGTTFRYDPGAQQYIFNLSTKNWSAGSYRITVLLDDGSQIMAIVGAR